MVLHQQWKNDSKQPSAQEEIKLEKPIETFWFITEGQKLFPDMLFSQNYTPTIPEKSSDKTFIVLVNQDAVTLTFIR